MLQLLEGFPLQSCPHLPFFCLHLQAWVFDLYPVIALYFDHSLNIWVRCSLGNKITLSILTSIVGMSRLTFAHDFFCTNLCFSWATCELSSVPGSSSTKYSRAQISCSTVAKHFLNGEFSQFCRLTQADRERALVHVVVGCNAYATVMRLVKAITLPGDWTLVAGILFTKSPTFAEDLLYPLGLLSNCRHKIVLTFTLISNPIRRRHSCWLPHL